MHHPVKHDNLIQVPCKRTCIVSRNQSSTRRHDNLSGDSIFIHWFLALTVPVVLFLYRHVSDQKEIIRTLQQIVYLSTDWDLICRRAKDWLSSILYFSSFSLCDCRSHGLVEPWVYRQLHLLRATTAKCACWTGTSFMSAAVSLHARLLPRYRNVGLS